MASGSTSLIVAAFDFGTTYSGYAFSFKDSPNDVKTNEKWYAGSGQLVSLKTSTSVLLNEKGEFDSFGFEAEDKYSNLAADEKHHGWRLFRRFKMILHNEKGISHSTTVEDLEGKSYPAFPIFTMSIRYLQQHLLRSLNTSKIGISESDINYIITVPAIWSIAAKMFMREAAIEAGIDGKRLKLALEPEAAAVCCEAVGDTLTGQKFMVLDIGGTADISVHEKQADGSLKNISAPSGGPWGGIYVDENFTKFLSEVFGTKAMSTMQTKEMYDYFDLIRDFEMKKRKFEFDSEADVTFRIPAALKENAEKYFHQSLSDRLASLKYGDRVFTRGKDKLGLKSSVMQFWFTKPVSKMVQHMQNNLQEERLRDVNFIILVGGFAESPYIQQRIREAFSGRRLIIPKDPGLAVLKGAVMFGHKPDVISSRVMEYTYGIDMWARYDANKFPVEKKVFKNGKWLVENVFKIFVRRNEDVQVGSKVMHNIKPMKIKLSIPIYRTTVRDPVYITDQGCELIGELRIYCDENIPLKEQSHETTFMFGDTELHVMSKNIKTGKVETLTLDLNK